MRLLYYIPYVFASISTSQNRTNRCVFYGKKTKSEAAKQYSLPLPFSGFDTHKCWNQAKKHKNKTKSIHFSTYYDIKNMSILYKKKILISSNKTDICRKRHVASVTSTLVKQLYINKVCRTVDKCW